MGYELWFLWYSLFCRWLENAQTIFVLEYDCVFSLSNWIGLVSWLVITLPAVRLITQTSQNAGKPEISVKPVNLSKKKT